LMHSIRKRLNRSPEAMRGGCSASDEPSTLLQSLRR
jgi:hypothetical protein